MGRVAEGILRQRRRRHEYFKASLFDEPGWNLLLQLYVRDSAGGSTTAEELLTSAATMASMAARWLAHLEEEGLVVRVAHPSDPATEFIELTNESRQAMEAYLTDVREP